MVGISVPAKSRDSISILLVEDDDRLAKLTGRYLQNNACRVTLARTVGEATDALRAEEFDTILLDLMLPDGDGLDLCRKIRQQTEAPIIIVTARGGPWDRVRGFDYGADDYVTKPFGPPELLARIRARVRRRRGQLGPAQGRLELGDLRLVRSEQAVSVGDTAVVLTAHEFHLLWSLALRSGTALRREQLVHGTELSERTVDVHISRIRAKLAKAGEGADVPPIRTVRGIGYMLAHNPPA
ncbi:MAG: response regulator transcription factor [Myxococcota bacterium]